MATTEVVLEVENMDGERIRFERVADGFAVTTAGNRNFTTLLDNDDMDSVTAFLMAMKD